MLMRLDRIWAREQNRIMKPSSMAVMIALATFVGGCEKNGGDVTTRDEDQKITRWVLEFDDKTMLKSQTAFTEALESATYRWERDVKIGNLLRADYTNIPENHPVHRPSVTRFPREKDAPGTAHVTQRVGLYSYEDYKNVLDQIQDP